MAQSRTRCMGMAVHKDSIAVADVSQAHGAQGAYLGAIGTRPYAREQMRRKRPAKAQPLIDISEAGPCGSWLYRYLTPKGDDCWVVAPSRIPQKPGERVTTHRRDAVHLARPARAGVLTLVSGPNVEEAASRALPRARNDPISALQDATFRLKSLLQKNRGSQ